MNDPNAVRERIKQLGAQFLERTTRELVTLRELVSRVTNSEPSAREELRQLAHRMHGTGATLGFESISRHAGEIEHWCDRGDVSTAPLHESLKNLETEVQTLTEQR